jgi:DNA polymerase I
MIRSFSEARQIWFVDFEYAAPAGEQQRPICLVAQELRSGRSVSVWEDELRLLREPPYAIGSDALFVAYYSSAELRCHLALGWRLPENIVDLYVEFRVRTNGERLEIGNSLLGALAYFGLPALGAAEKEEMRSLALRGGPWISEERKALIAYCKSDVVALTELYLVMESGIDLLRAQHRGRYMQAVARMESMGVPTDTHTLHDLTAHWDPIQERLVAEVDRDFGVFEGRSFRTERFARYLEIHNIPWPRLASGRLALDDDTFRERARAYPILRPLKELRATLAQLRPAELAVGRDGRNRALLSPYRSKTSRNQPSSSRFIFGPASWVRSLILPDPGTGLAYVDYEQEEFGIAAALSGDPNMIAAYHSGDPYLAFARQAGAAPDGATKESHPIIRERFKACALAVQYGMEADALALRIGQSHSHARELLRLHHETYGKFWRWSDAAVDFGNLYGYLHTVFGWRIKVGPDSNSRSLRNFPMQSNGAEILRLACCMTTEAGIAVCAPVHDALLIEAPLVQLDDVVATTRRLMAEAAAVVLDGFELRTEVCLVRYPDRFRDAKGDPMFTRVMAILSDLKSLEVAQPHIHACSTCASALQPCCATAQPDISSISLLK